MQPRLRTGRVRESSLEAFVRDCGWSYASQEFKAELAGHPATVDLGISDDAMLEDVRAVTHLLGQLMKTDASPSVPHPSAPARREVIAAGIRFNKPHPPDPLVILSPARSFSSVVSTMIGEHPQLYGFPELHICTSDSLEDLIQWEARRGFLGPPGLLRLLHKNFTACKASAPSPWRSLGFVKGSIGRRKSFSTICSNG